MHLHRSDQTKESVSGGKTHSHSHSFLAPKDTPSHHLVRINTLHVTTMIRRTIYSILCAVIALQTTSAFSTQKPTKVLVTGAGGKTGQLVLEKLLEHPMYEPKALVRSEESAKKLIKGNFHCPLESVIVGDITSPTFHDDMPSEVDDTKAMIICTSAVPKISRRSLARAMFKIPLNILRRKKAIDFRSLRFKWKNGGYPEQVDYYGQINQIDWAKRNSMERVVIVSSMGVTDPDNFLNNVGKNKDGTGHGDILQWKRKAEEYLVESGMDYSIIHPGGLVDTPGGVEHFVLDTDDKLLKSGTHPTRISRADVADLCIASINLERGQNVSFDCITHVNANDETPISADQALSSFLKTSTVSM